MQMAGLTVQNFLSAHSGIAVIFALIRAFTRQSMSTLRNAWVDLLHHVMGAGPCSVVGRTVLFNKVRCKLSAYQAVNTVEGCNQLLPMGPVASREAIKMLGTNGGGF